MHLDILAILQYAVYALVYGGYAYVLNLMLNKMASEHHMSRSTQENDGNLALALRKGGAHLGLGIGMLGVLLGGSQPDFVKDLISTVGFGALTLTFILSSMVSVDRLVLPRINNNKEIYDGNVAVGLVEFGSLTATGIIAMASMYGDTGGILSALLYFVIGQVTIVGLVLAYEILTKDDLLENIAKQEAATGLYLSGKMIAYGLILMSAIKGDGVSRGFLEAAGDYAIAAALGMMFLYAFEWLIDLVILTRTDVHKMLSENSVTDVIRLTMPKIGMALILGFAIL